MTRIRTFAAEDLRSAFPLGTVSFNPVGACVLGRTNAKGMPRLLEAALLAEAFGDEIVAPERFPQKVRNHRLPSTVT